jgi:uncharacterized protein YndB with AHSA1/START domain
MPEVRREVVLPVARDRAWELITDPEELAGWLADEVELEEAEPGAPLRVSWASGERREGVLEAVEPERRLAFWWSDDRAASEVEWSLEDDPRGTRLIVVERTLVRTGTGWGPTLAARCAASVAWGPVTIASPGAGRGGWGPRLSALAHVAALCLA